RIDADFLPTIDITLVAGNNFTPQTVRQDQILVNEEALQWLGLQSPQEAIGSQITEGGAPLTIIGVVQNYHQRSPKEPHLPMIFPYTAMGDYFTLKINTSQLSEAMTIIEDAWGQVFPTSTFDYFFLDETYDQQYRADSRFGQVVAIFCGLAIFIACLGLFGLSSYSALQRMKEIGIRKVLGATVGQMALLLSGDFIRLVILSGILALPLSYFVIKYWLESYAVRVSLSWWIFLLPIVLILVIALVTISFQTVKAAKTNPVVTLRSE
ncbi:MAG: FtsX-like permease family protein, partial [Bacteroidota bacterium]